MKFAELTQEVVVARPVERQLDTGIGLTPGRRKANQVRRAATGLPVLGSGRGVSPH